MAAARAMTATFMVIVLSLALLLCCVVPLASSFAFSPLPTAPSSSAAARQNRGSSVSTSAGRLPRLPAWFGGGGAEPEPEPEPEPKGNFVTNFFSALDDFVDDATSRRMGNGAKFYGKRKSGFYGKEDKFKKTKRGFDPSEDYQVRSKNKS